jgi:hypothetical protein
MDLMHRHFSHNMGTVSFWLNFCVIPIETRQYPKRLVASAWHLADNPRGLVVGFSGTNDNYRLLPLQVQQQLEVEPSLRVTNGKMLAMLLDNPEYDTLAPQVNVPHICKFFTDSQVDFLGGFNGGSLGPGSMDKQSHHAIDALRCMSRIFRTGCPG